MQALYHVLQEPKLTFCITQMHSSQNLLRQIDMLHDVYLAALWPPCT